MLQVIIVVLVAANLGAGGMGEVALPALAHGPFGAGAGGYGALLAAYGGGALLGTLAAGQARRARRPAVVASVGFLVEAACLALVPYLGGTIPAAAALLAFGALNGFGSIILFTAFQRWAPPAMLGQLMAVLLLAAIGVFPVSVFVAGLLVDHLGPAPFFPLAGALLAVAIAVSLSQRSWRDFGSAVKARPGEDEPMCAALAVPDQPGAARLARRPSGRGRNAGRGISWRARLACARPRLASSCVLRSLPSLAAAPSDRRWPGP